MSFVKVLVTGRIPDYVTEEDDFYGSFINKRLRKYRKKLKEIEDLEAKTHGELDESQRDKIKSKEDQEYGIQLCEDLLKLYTAAWWDAKEANEEPKIHLVPGKKELKKLEKKQAKAGGEKAEKPAQPEAPAKEQPKKAAAPQKESPKNEVDNTATLVSVLNLVHSALYFADHSRVEEYRRAVAKEGAESGVDAHDLNVIVEFYSKVFTYTESSRFTPNIDKIQQAAEELQKYLDRTKNAALKNKTYSDLFDVVERVANSKHFQEKTVEPTPAVKHEPKYQGVIGSEIRTKTPAEAPQQPAQQVHHKEEKQAPAQPAQQPVQHAPAPAHHEPAIPAQQYKDDATKTSNKQNWAEVGDDEEDEEDNADDYAPAEIERGGKSSGEEPEDGGWTVVGANRRDQKQGEQQGGRGGRGRGRGGPRRGGRGGPRRPREEGGEGGPRPEGGYRGGRGGRGGPREGGPREGGEGGYRGPRRHEGEGGEGGYRGPRRHEGEGGEGGYRGGRGGPRRGGGGKFHGGEKVVYSPVEGQGQGGDQGAGQQ